VERGEGMGHMWVYGGMLLARSQVHPFGTVVLLLCCSCLGGSGFWEYPLYLRHKQHSSGSSSSREVLAMQGGFEAEDPAKECLLEVGYVCVCVCVGGALAKTPPKTGLVMGGGGIGEHCWGEGWREWGRGREG